MNTSNTSNRLQRVLLFFAAACVVAFGVTFPVYNGYAARSQLVQRIEYDEAAASLLGEPGPPVGSPQQLIIDDPKAFLKGSAAGGMRLVNEAYLRRRGIYPLQLKTVEFVTRLTRWALAAVFAASVGGLWLLRRKARR